MCSMCLEQYLKDSKHSMLAKINEQIIVLDNSGIKFRFIFVYLKFYKLNKFLPKILSY